MFIRASLALYHEGTKITKVTGVPSSGEPSVPLWYWLGGVEGWTGLRLG
jgi:hypothetical protein